MRGRAQIVVAFDDVATALGLQHGLEIVTVEPDPGRAVMTLHVRSDRFDVVSPGIDAAPLPIEHAVVSDPMPHWLERRRLRSVFGR